MKNSRPTCQQQPLKWGPRPLGCSGSSSTSPAHSSLWKWGGGRVGRLFAVFSGQPCKRGTGQRKLDRNWTLLTCTITCAITEQRPHIHLNTVPLQGRICMQPLYLNSGSASAFLFCRYMQNAKLCKERRELGWSGPSSAGAGHSGIFGTAVLLPVHDGEKGLVVTNCNMESAISCMFHALKHRNTHRVPFLVAEASSQSVDTEKSRNVIRTWGTTCYVHHVEECVKFGDPCFLLRYWAKKKCGLNMGAMTGKLQNLHIIWNMNPCSVHRCKVWSLPILARVLNLLWRAGHFLPQIVHTNSPTAPLEYF